MLLLAAVRAGLWALPIASIVSGIVTAGSAFGMQSDSLEALQRVLRQWSAMPEDAGKGHW